MGRLARLVAVWAAIGILLTVAAATAPTAAAVKVRWDNYEAFWGNLSWSGGSGRIVWGPNPSSEDDKPGPHFDANQRTLAPVMDVASSYSSRARMPSPPSEEFKSDPIPHDLVLNVSRAIQLELFLKSNPNNPTPCAASRTRQIGVVTQFVAADPRLVAELRVGEKILAGGYSTDTVTWTQVGPERTAPPNPPGYGRCIFSMHPEAFHLPAGSILTLHISRISQAYEYPFGFQGDHASRIRLPLLPAEEIVYRYPDLVEAEEGGADEASPGWLLPLLVGGAALGRGRRLPLALVAALVLAAMSGCVQNKGGAPHGKDDAATGGRVDSTLVRALDDQLGAAGLGSILGQVFDDLHMPLAGVHVSLLGESSFTRTDGKGRFQFANMLPGTYKVRFDKEEHKSFEASVEVKAGFISRPNVMLYMINPKDRDFRPHSHDYWQGKQQVDIMNAAIQPSCSGVPEACSMPSSWRIPVKPDEINTVLPGTRTLEVRLSWDPAKFGAPKLGLVLRHNYEFIWGNSSTFAPRGPNEPFYVQTSWEMSDVGHNPVSTWTFNWFNPTPGLATLDYYTDYYTRLEKNPGPVQIQMKIHRGPTLPLEPPHPDHWSGATSLQTVKDILGKYRSSNVPPGTPSAMCSSSSGGSPEFNTCYTVYWMRATPNKVVPTGTDHIEFTMQLSRRTQPFFDWILYYKPANTPPQGFLAAPSAVYVSMPSTSNDGTTFKWKIPVKPLEADPEYAKATGWDFFVGAADEQAKWADYNTNMETMNGGQGLPKMQVTMNAHARRGG